MSLKLYVDLMSQPCRTVALFLRANSVPHEEILIKISKGEHNDEKYEKINPFCKVPAIDHNGFKITESTAILPYICRTHKIPDHWYPKNDFKKLAIIESYMAWQHLNLRLYGSMYFQTMLFPSLQGEKPDPNKLMKYEQGLETAANQIESIWLKDRSFIASNEISIADLFAATELEQPRMMGYEYGSKFPQLEAYRERVRSTLSPIYDDVHSVTYKVKKRFQSQQN